jgi:autotransporter-associated beta strand protein
MAALLVGSITSSTVFAQATVYWDINGTAAGATNGDGIGDGTWNTGVAANWNPLADGTGTPAAWTAGDHAVFAAGNDLGTDPLVAGAFVTLDSVTSPQAASILIEEGFVGFRTGAVDSVQTTVNAGAILDIDSILRYTTTPGKITLAGGTFKQSNPGSAGSFIRNSQTLEIDGSGTIVYEGGGGGCNCSIFTPLGVNTITGVGGTTANGGAGTLTKDGAGEFRYQGVGLPLTTFAKLVVNEGLYRLGFSAATSDERGFGAVPLAFTSDAITINGAAIGTSFGVTLHANRGITIGAGDAWFNNSAGTMTVPGEVTGTGALRKDIDPMLIKGSATGAGTLNLTSPTGNTYGGGTFINAGNLKVLNTSGSGTGSGPVTIGGSSTTQFGTLLGSGIISGLVTLNQFGELRPTGNTTLTLDNSGTFTLNGGLTLNSGSLLTYNLLTAGNDLTVVGGVNGLNIAGPVTLNLSVPAMTTFSGPGTYPILDYDTSFVGSVSDITLGTTPDPTLTYALVNNPANTSIDLVVTAPFITGDHNQDGVVDLADYVTWRKDPNSFGGDPQGYIDWSTHFGEGTPGSGGNTGAVPEPTALAMLLLGVAAIATRRRGR